MNESSGTVDAFMRLIGAQLAERAWKDIYEFGSPEAKQKLADAVLDALPEMMRYTNASVATRIYQMPEVKSAMEAYAKRVCGYIDGFDPASLADETKERILAEVKREVETKLRDNMMLYVKK
ncbi:MAG: hypothetical protein EPN91_08425 [Salinibacterium sp.]|nr:MAG: hypothetical protein EPN91_08425 [Salinibacterium sp.]